MTVGQQAAVVERHLIGRTHNLVSRCLLFLLQWRMHTEQVAHFEQRYWLFETGKEDWSAEEWTQCQSKS